jgi:hypothetical protein
MKKSIKKGYVLQLRHRPFFFNKNPIKKYKSLNGFQLFLKKIKIINKIFYKWLNPIIMGIVLENLEDKKEKIEESEYITFKEYINIAKEYYWDNKIKQFYNMIGTN